MQFVQIGCVAASQASACSRVTYGRGRGAESDPARCGQGERVGDARTDVVALHPQFHLDLLLDGYEAAADANPGRTGSAGLPATAALPSRRRRPRPSGSRGPSTMNSWMLARGWQRVEIAGRNEALDEPGPGALRVPLQLGGDGGQESVVGHGLSHRLAAVPWAGSSPVSPDAVSAGAGSNQGDPWSALRSASLAAGCCGGWVGPASVCGAGRAGWER
jgi:hypothetical protein